MKADTWMAFYVGDYLADTLTLTTRQHGAYLLLILACWKGGGFVSSDDETLAAITKLSVKDWQHDKPKLAPYFEVSLDRWTHNRVQRELQEAVRLTQERSKAGGKGAANRWRGHSNRTAEPLANTQQTDAPSQSPSPSSEEPSGSSGGSPPPDPVKLLFDAGVKLLTENGCTERNARMIIGKWRGEHGDEATHAAVKAAREEGITEPIAWITQRFAGKTRETWDQRRIREAREAIQ